MKRAGVFSVSALLVVAMGVAGCATESRPKTGSSMLVDLDPQPGPISGPGYPDSVQRGPVLPLPVETPTRAEPGAKMTSSMLIDLRVDPKLIIPKDKIGQPIPVPEEPRP